MNDLIDALLQRAEALFQSLDALPLSERIVAINALRMRLHAHSPFAGQPVDCVQWVSAEQVVGNDYNPNAVAAPELRLLEHSIRSDGFTQPIVVHREGGRHVVVDGFHRQRMGKEVAAIREQLHGYLPVALARADRGGTGERMAATIRHNRARGVHAVMPMTDIVAALIRQGWSDGQVATELGMDEDEVRRFKQVSGLPELFRDHPYSRSWE
jgi:ParB-like chromosome segregation protein Spo0J